MKKLNLDIIKKVIIGTLIGLMIIMACMFKYQNEKIDRLEHDLVIKQEVHTQEFDYTETEAYADTIEETFNETGELVVMKGEINIKHKYVLDEKGWLGISQTETLVATATAYYEFATPLNEAKVETRGNKIIVTLKAPQLKEDATHRIANTMHVIEDETDSSFFSTKENARKVVRYWEDTFDKRANERIADLYREEELNKQAIKQVKDLLIHLTGNPKIEIRVEG